MKTSIFAIPSLDEDADVRLVVELGKQSALVAMSSQQVAREITDVLMRSELDASNFIDRLRDTTLAARPGRRASQLPSVTVTPSCKGCGTAVAAAGDLCAACAHKTHLKGPQATIALVSQGEPLYKREGNFRDAPSEREETT